MINEIFSRIIWVVEIIKDFVIVAAILYFFGKRISMKIKQALSKHKELKKEDETVYLYINESQVEEIK